VYKDGGWQGWGHWLGTGNLPFKEALVFARSLKMHSRQAWQSWSAKGLRPVNVPACPCQVYKNSGWQGWGHWLGTGTAKRGPEQFLPFTEALAMARSLKLPGQKQWKLWSKSGARPAGMPSAPDRTYRLDGWEGFGHWLGTGNRLHQVKAFLPFQEALVLARSLHLDSPASWSARSRKEFLRARNVPVDPSRSYVTCRTRAARGLPLAALEAMGELAGKPLVFGSHQRRKAGGARAAQSGRAQTLMCRPATPHVTRWPFNASLRVPGTQTTGGRAGTTGWAQATRRRRSACRSWRRWQRRGPPS